MSGKGDDRDRVEDPFNLSKAELFEALGHPTRIRLLKILVMKPTTFSELKRAAEIESNGLLGFHLGKLSGLVKLNSDGLYSLTDEGKEALRIVEATTQSRRKNVRDDSSSSLSLSIFTAPLARLRHSRTILLAIFLIALVVLGLVVVYQQEQMARLNNSINSSTVSIDGQQYWYLEESATSFASSGSLYFHGVNFTIAPMYLSNGTGTAFLNNATFIVSHYNTTGPYLITLTIVPNIVANFGKGNLENWNYTPDVLWLSQHNDPRAGISYNQNIGLLTFYVSL